VLALGKVALPIDASTGGPSTSIESLLITSFLWIVGLLIVFVPIAIRQYRKLT